MFRTLARLAVAGTIAGASLVAFAGVASATNVNWSVTGRCGDDHYIHFTARVNNDHNEPLTFHIDGSSSWFGPNAAVAPGGSTNYPIGMSAYPALSGSVAFFISASYPSGASPHLSPGNTITYKYTSGQCGVVASTTTTTVASTTTEPTTTVPETTPPTEPTTVAPEPTTVPAATTVPECAPGLTLLTFEDGSTKCDDGSYYAVVKPAETAQPAAPQVPNQLPATGSGDAVPLVVIGAGVLAAGVLLVAVRRLPRAS